MADSASNQPYLPMFWGVEKCLYEVSYIYENGLCIDGDDEVWPLLKKRRSCRVIEHCIDENGDKLIFISDRGNNLYADSTDYNNYFSNQTFMAISRSNRSQRYPIICCNRKNF